MEGNREREGKSRKLLFSFSERWMIAMKNVVIIGVGALGKRHLEAVLKTEFAMQIFCMDVNPNALEGYAFDDKFSNKKITFTQDFSEIPKDIDIAILSMSAKGRREAFEQLIEHSKVKNIIFEKILFQKIEDYEYVGKRLKELNINAWVNCPRRYTELWEELYNELKEVEQFEFHTFGGNWGLACNGIHMLDVIDYLTGSNNDELKIEKMKLLSDPIESKRDGYKEVFGLVSGECGKCINFSISCYDSNLEFETIIITPNAKYFIDETLAKVKRVGIDGNITEKKYMPCYVSEITKLAVNDIINHQECKLTKYETSAYLHLEYIKPLINYFEEKGFEREVCPIT